MKANPKAALLSPVVVLLAACGPTAKAFDPPQPARPPYALLAGADGFYVNPDNPAAKWVRTAPPGPRTDSIRTRIATRPAATLIAEPAATAREEVRAAVTAAAAGGSCRSCCSTRIGPVRVRTGVRGNSARWREGWGTTAR
ncbi:hypothetical protein AB0383_46495 [Amycolatopsis sp. NPDC051373]|uniref:hypothetical protein n=1 Tax=Amycolatopsis sp. NPDC051373 TaxID=3155801 RepID=UPI0034507CBF